MNKLTVTAAALSFVAGLAFGAWLRPGAQLPARSSESPRELLATSDPFARSVGWNALLERSEPADLPALCDRFSRALADFGYPECPGRIMLSNPAWRGSVSEFAQRAKGGQP